ncbi:uncharacterized protein [Haliotis asinina]|uniref:uncharacterized protein n=1 Tax=Haliotis asinina TaxID=109174 RepID=UPI003531C781
MVHSPQSPKQLMHYLDDFLTGGVAGTSDCAHNLQSCMQVLNHFNAAVAPEKTVQPTTKITFLGRELDTVVRHVRIPQDKIVETTTQIRGWLSADRKKVTKRDLQSFVGKLNFMCRAIPRGRAFCRRLIDETCKLKSPFHRCRLTTGIKDDLALWLQFLEHFNGISFFQSPVWTSNTAMQLITDAAGGVGFGAYNEGKWTCGHWPQQWVEEGVTKDMTLLELFPIVLSVGMP